MEELNKKEDEEKEDIKKGREGEREGEEGKERGGRGLGRRGREKGKEGEEIRNSADGSLLVFHIGHVFTT